MEQVARSALERWGQPRQEIRPEERRNPLTTRLLLYVVRRWPSSTLSTVVNTCLSSDFRCYRFGEGLQMSHPFGIVVHGDVRLGDYCRIQQNVTIGAHNRKHGLAIIGNDVMIGAGAKIIGPVRIGNGAWIGANAVVLHDIPDYAIALGVPARVTTYRTDPTAPSSSA